MLSRQSAAAPRAYQPEIALGKRSICSQRRLCRHLLDDLSAATGMYRPSFTARSRQGELYVKSYARYAPMRARR